MAGDDSPKDGAFPIIASVGVHAEQHPEGERQIIANMIRSGEKHRIPLVGSVFHRSDDVHTYTMNGVILSEVRAGNSIEGKIDAGLPLVLLYEEQRSNGITLQRRVLEEAFGRKWYAITVSDAMGILNKKLNQKYKIPVLQDKRTLGELVAQPSTPYFRVDSLMPKTLLDTIKLRVNVSSGGLIGKTRRALEPLKLGATYFDVFEAPPLTLILQMASRVKGSVGAIPDVVAYYTWGCGNGAIVGTTGPNDVLEYYRGAGVRAQGGGIVTKDQRVIVLSKAFDSMQRGNERTLIHNYSDKPLG